MVGPFCPSWPSPSFSSSSSLSMVIGHSTQIESKQSFLNVWQLVLTMVLFFRLASSPSSIPLLLPLFLYCLWWPIQLLVATRLYTGICSDGFHQEIHQEILSQSSFYTSFLCWVLSGNLFLHMCEFVRLILNLLN